MTPKLHDRTVMPPTETESLSSLNAMLAAMRDDQGKAVLVGPDDVRWDLPAEAYRVLREVLEAMAKGLAITVMPRHTMLTTQEAADMLGISRPTLVKLLGEGVIPFEQRGRHRRLLLTDVLDYQQRARVERSRQLDEMTDEAAQYDLYRDTATPRPTR
jgi:excisionase family DNA binding protein